MRLSAAERVRYYGANLKESNDQYEAIKENDCKKKAKKFPMEFQGFIDKIACNQENESCMLGNVHPAPLLLLLSQLKLTVQ